MRKVVVYELMSLDGVAEAPDEFIASWDEAMDTHLAEVIETQDAVILGRRSFDEWARYWPGSDVEPFATFINNVAKHIATSRPLDQSWSNAEAITGGLPEYLLDLKTRPGGDIGVHANISVARALLSAGLVDELKLVIAPIVAARGRRLFDPTPPLRFQMISCAASQTGHLLAHLRPAAPGAALTR